MAVLHSQPLHRHKFVVDDGSNSAWAGEAAQALHSNGFCVLSSHNGKLVPSRLSEHCKSLVMNRLASLLQFALSFGFDGEAPIRSREICQRDFLARRYDMNIGEPMNYLDPHEGNESDEWLAACGSLAERDAEVKAWSELRATVDPFVRPVIVNALQLQGAAGGEVTVDAPHAGCVVGLAGAEEQTRHRDSLQAGLFNVFVPLVDINASNGGTRLWPGTHRAAPLLEGEVLKPRPSHAGRAVERVRAVLARLLRWRTEAVEVVMRDAVSPMPQRGDILVFNHRLFHAGGANKSGAPRPIAYLIYAVNGVRDHRNFPGESLCDFCARERIEPGE